MIVGFSDRKTEAFYKRRRIAADSGFARTASRKLDQLDAATSLGDPARPGNRLEALKARRKGQGEHPHQQPVANLFQVDASFGSIDVEIVDYH